MSFPLSLLPSVKDKLRWGQLRMAEHALSLQGEGERNVHFNKRFLKTQYSDAKERTFNGGIYGHSGRSDFCKTQTLVSFKSHCVRNHLVCISPGLAATEQKYLNDAFVYLPDGAQLFSRLESS